MIRILASIFTLLASFALACAADAQAQDIPRLELKSPFAGTPNSLDADATGNYLVSAGSARSLVVWSRYGENKWSPTIIHPPRRDEFEGGPYLAAITPDAKYIAFAVPPLSDHKGGFLNGTARIYIIERLERKLITIFENKLPSRVTRLKFSPDGHHMAAMLANGCGLRIWSNEQWTSPARNQDPEWADDVGYAGVAGVARCCIGGTCEPLPKGTDVVFTDDNEAGVPWLLILSENGFRSYAKSDQGLSQLDYISREQLSLVRPGKIAITRDKDKVAIGDASAPRISVLHREGVHYLPYLPPRIFKVPESLLSPIGKERAERRGYFANPLWMNSGDKLRLYAFGYFQSENLAAGVSSSTANNVTIFDYDSGGVDFMPLQDDVDTSLAIIRPPGTNTVFTMSTGYLRAFDIGSDGELSPSSVAQRRSLDLRGNESKFALKLNKTTKELFLSAVAGDNKFITVALDFATMRITGSHYFNGEELTSEVGAHGADQGFYDAKADAKQWRFERRVADDLPVFFDKRLHPESIDLNEYSFSGALVPEGTRAIWGTDKALRVINSDGEIKCARPIGSLASRMNVTPDGRLVVVTHGDGVIRWYHLNDAKDDCLPLVASVYLTQNVAGDWGVLAWLPNGKFMTTGAAAGSDIACYPVEKPGELPACVDFQQTDSSYSPRDVLAALAEAAASEKASPDPNLRNILAAKLQQEKITIDFDAEFKASIADFKIAVSVGQWSTGMRYLTLDAGVDVPFSYDGGNYGANRPLQLAPSGKFPLMLTLPQIVQRQNREFLICPKVYSGLLADGTPDEKSRQPLAKGQPCYQIKWVGSDNGPIKRKLWVLIVGFPRESKLTPPLRFAHEDAIDFARFLQWTTGKVPDGKPGQPYFDDIMIRLLVAPPGNADDKAVFDLPRIKRLRQELGDERLVVEKLDGKPYDTVMKNALKSLHDGISDPDPAYNWEHVILVYFSGHGFSEKYAPDPLKPEAVYARAGLVTPSADTDLESGIVWVDDVLNELQAVRGTRIVIIDACRAELRQGFATDFNQLARLSFYKRLEVQDGASWHFLFSSDVGHFSYEQSEYAIDDFVPNFALWPPELQQKGNSIFTLGFLASLLCDEANDEENYDLDSSKKFLRRYFFKESNHKWQEKLRPELEQIMQKYHLPFIIPDPVYEPHGRPEDATLRLKATNAPRCFSAGSQ